jgi:plasmid stabilization system protein ParE
MSGYVLHPEAFTDIDQIWEYVAQDNIDAADACLRTSSAPSIGS